jgi:hypothetical protein
MADNAVVAERKGKVRGDHHADYICDEELPGLEPPDEARKPKPPGAAGRTDPCDPAGALDGVLVEVRESVLPGGADTKHWTPSVLTVQRCSGAVLARQAGASPSSLIAQVFPEMGVAPMSSPGRRGYRTNVRTDRTGCSCESRTVADG